MTNADLLKRLLGLKSKAYSEKTARKALKELEGSVLTKRQEGQNVYYRRATEG